VSARVEGRALAGSTDDCAGICAGGGANTFAAGARIARQTGGKRLDAAFD
jgi:hypothetical protein